MNSLRIVLVVAAFVLVASEPLVFGQIRLPPSAPRPIEAGDSLWAEELTSMEIRRRRFYADGSIMSYLPWVMNR